MTPESLKELLARVHERLGAGGGAIDSESRELLGTVMRDIARVAPEAGAAAHVPRVRELAVRFEAGHPALAEALRELMDALVKAGI